MDRIFYHKYISMSASSSTAKHACAKANYYPSRENQGKTKLLSNLFHLKYIYILYLKMQIAKMTQTKWNKKCWFLLHC